MRITLAQLNPLVGDVEGNLQRISKLLPKCKREKSDLLVLPELFITGYPPRDLLERKWFIKKVQEGVKQLALISKKFPGIGILFGTPVPTGIKSGRGLYNSALLIYEGRILFRADKTLLPTYDVFDEGRYFDPAKKTDAIRFKDEKLGISVCEDAWNETGFWRRKVYDVDPIGKLAKKRATLLINISASPFYVGKEELRFHILGKHARRHRIPLIFVNQVGANDELVFDGRSMCFNKRGELVSIFPSFEEHVETIEINARDEQKKKRMKIDKIDYVPQESIGSVHDALILGIRDYMRKCAFRKAVVGLSGGIDSSVVACLASEALGAKNVLGIAMPSKYNAKESTGYARILAGKLKIRFKIIGIEGIYETYLESLKKDLKEGHEGEEVSIAMQNIQARIRGNILMALSNEFGDLVLSTGNKSELACGYCTLYGDMSGGLAVLSDVPKTMVYGLARHMNQKAKRQVIPKWIIERIPTAELKPNQKDQDTLPPYGVLDEILNHYIDEGLGADEIKRKTKISMEIIGRTIGMVNSNEYKRRQAAVGLKVTSKAFGMGRRMPIAAKY